MKITFDQREAVELIGGRHGGIIVEGFLSSKAGFQGDNGRCPRESLHCNCHPPKKAALRKIQRCNCSLLQGLGFGLFDYVSIGVGNQYGLNLAGEYQQIVTAVTGKNGVVVIKPLMLH